MHCLFIFYVLIGSCKIVKTIVTWQVYGEKKEISFVFLAEKKRKKDTGIEIVTVLRIFL